MLVNPDISFSIDLSEGIEVQLMFEQKLRWSNLKVTDSWRGQHLPDARETEICCDESIGAEFRIRGDSSQIQWWKHHQMASTVEIKDFTKREWAVFKESNSVTRGVEENQESYGTKKQHMTSRRWNESLRLDGRHIDRKDSLSKKGETTSW